MTNYRNNSLGVFIACSIVLCVFAAAVLMSAHKVDNVFSAAKDEATAAYEVGIGVVTEKFVKSRLFKNDFTLCIEVDYEYEGEDKTISVPIVVPEQTYLNVAVGDTFNFRTQEIVDREREP